MEAKRKDLSVDAAAAAGQTPDWNTDSDSDEPTISPCEREIGDQDKSNPKMRNAHQYSGLHSYYKPTLDLTGEEAATPSLVQTLQKPLERTFGNSSAPDEVAVRTVDVGDISLASTTIHLIINHGQTRFAHQLRTRLQNCCKNSTPYPT